MKSRRKSRKYKSQGNREARRRLVAVLVWVGSGIAAILIAAIIGNALGTSADANKTAFGTVGAAPLYTYESEGIPNISAVALNGISESGINGLPSGITAVSVELRSGSSAPAYFSEVSGAVTGNFGGSAKLSEIVEKLKARGIYVSGIFNVTFQSKSDEQAAKAVMSYEAALVGEALDCGIDEIVITGLSPDTESAEQASQFFKMIREKYERAVLGAAFSYKLFEKGEAAGFIEKYAKFASFCGVDTRGLVSTAVTSSAMAEQYLIYFEKYPLRLVIETVGNENAKLQMENLAKLGIYNVQCIATLIAAG